MISWAKKGPKFFPPLDRKSEQDIRLVSFTLNEGILIQIENHFEELQALDLIFSLKHSNGEVLRTKFNFGFSQKMIGMQAGNYKIYGFYQIFLFFSYPAKFKSINQF
ncbi:MAG: hypothetical protein CM15mP4_2880 [Candidatus Neomarinimicrobiota bacterium]|nr:MAG: hypothetical protein CM15mP4_2880 [Candidatus Neomarinimicrobiota bacterium]